MVSEVAVRLTNQYGTSFDKASISRMIKFYEEFPEYEKVATLSQQLTWSHFVLDGKDYYMDLLFYHRSLRRLVLVELKLEEFELQDKGQVELYLRWLEKYEKAEGEDILLLIYRYIFVSIFCAVLIMFIYLFAYKDFQKLTGFKSGKVFSNHI